MTGWLSSPQKAQASVVKYTAFLHQLLWEQLSQ